MQHYQAYLYDEEATAALGMQLAHALEPGMAIHLLGDLGAGKTALTRAMLHALGHQGHVKSPTYALAEPYRVRIGEREVGVIHFDLYRMASPEEFLDAGFREDFNGDNICVVEWPQKAEGVLPPPDLAISLRVNGDGRDVELQAFSDLGQLCLDRLNFAPNLG